MKILKNNDKQFPFTIEFHPDRKQKLTKNAMIELIKLSMDSLTDDERFDIMSSYCKYCGEINSNYQCWNN